MHLSRQTVAETLFVVLAPIIAFLSLHICLINQDGSIDSWLYTGYAQEFKILQQISGWLYYNVRFPVVLLNLAIPKDLDPIVGFALLRYVLVLSCGVPLYLWGRKHFGVAHAIAAYLFLFFNPLFARILAWDLTPFVSVPMALAGITLWQTSTKFTAVSRALSGFVFCASVASHAFTGTAIALFFFVEAVRRLIRREYSDLILLDMGAPTAGAAVCLAVGLICYYFIVGPFDPSAIFTTTLNAIRAGDQTALSQSGPINTWIWKDTYVFVPPILVGFVAIGFTDELLNDTVVARVWWFGFFYCAAYAIYQFIFDRFVLAEFLYFFHLTLVAYLLFPVCLHLITRKLTMRNQIIVVMVALAVLISAPLLKNHFIFGPDALEATFTKFRALIILSIFLCGFFIWSFRFAQNVAIISAVYAAMLVLAIQFETLSAPAFASIISNPAQGREYDLYRAAVEMLRVFGRYATPSGRVALWCAQNETSVAYMAVAAYPNTINQYYQGLGLPNIGPYERSSLRSSSLKYIMMLSEKPELIAEGKQALTRNGYHFHEVERRTIGGASYALHLDLILLLEPTREKAMAGTLAADTASPRVGAMREPADSRSGHGSGKSP